MTIAFQCDDKQTLMDYVYGEIEPATRGVVDDHLARCEACAAEVNALGGVRSELGLWVPPDVQLNFTIVKKTDLPASNVLRPARWWSTVPVWAQAAAALLVLAAGAGMANLQIRSGPDGFSVSTGWIQPAATVVPAQTPGDDEWKTALVSLEQQLRNEIQSTRAQATPVSAPSQPDEATIRRVQQLIAASEQRHERALAARFIDFTRDINMQRSADLRTIGRGMVSYDEQLLRQRQLLNNVIRVSATGQQ